ncbi:hypothetical protein ACVWZM_001557 [Bradyrhizobium sp. USDA 4501]
MHLVMPGTVMARPGRRRTSPGFVPLPCDQRLLELVQGRLRSKHPDAIDPEVDGLAVLQLQRENPHLKNGDCCFVGGFAQVTTVMTDSITTRIIHAWPDELGRRI